MNAYHYCSVSSFFSIISSGNLWLSSYDSLNDYLEVSYFRDALRQASQNDVVKGSFFERVLNQVEDRSIFICSLSKHKDSLTQWRSYADDGSGIAIGFSWDFLDDDDVDTPIIFGGKKIYDEFLFSSVEYKSSDEIISFLNDFEAQSDVTNGNNDDYDYLTYALKEISSFRDITTKIINTKTKDFEHEGELRISSIISEDRHSLIKQRTDGINITSYCEFDFKRKQKAIVEVVLGPKCKVRLSEIKRLLEVHGHKDAVITKSSVSYR